MGFLSKLFAPRTPFSPIVVEQRRWLMVYEVRVDAGWELYEDELRDDDIVVHAMKLVRSDDVLVLMAKDYSKARHTPADDLGARDWSAHYAKVFDDVTNLRVAHTRHMLMDRVVPGRDIVVEGTVGAEAHRMRERYANVGGHALVVTAAGLASAHERFAHEIERWFSRVAFRLSR